MNIARQRKVDTLLNIAPLIDCVFLLLIFFLLTSTFIEENAIEIDLPESAQGKPQEGAPLLITVTEDGGIHVGGVPSAMETLTGDVKKALGADASGQAVLRADKSVRLGMLTTLMDRIKAGGIRQLAVQTSSAQDEPQTGDSE